MKTAIICFNCNKPRRFSDSYAVKITDYSNPIELENLGSLESAYIFPQKKVRICRVCIKRMGYKVKTMKKKEVKKDGNV